MRSLPAVNKVRFFSNNWIFSIKSKMLPIAGLYNRFFVSSSLDDKPWLQNLSLDTIFTELSWARMIS